MFQVVRCFIDDDIHHVSDRSSIRDVDVINTERILADIASLQSAVSAFRNSSIRPIKPQKSKALSSSECYHPQSQ